MQFLYYPSISSSIILRGNEHKYLFKVRRVKKNELIRIRNLEDDYLYTYKIEDINKKEAYLKLINKELKPNKPHTFFHLAWCIIDPKNIEKIIPTLNEIGVSKISFVYCDYSQKNFKLRTDRIKTILINSCQQCGRSDLMEIEIINSSQEFFEKYPEFTAIDFNGEEINCNTLYKNPFFLGPEGGFSEEERKFFKKTIKLKGFILRSESAACAIASKILL